MSHNQQLKFGVKKLEGVIAACEALGLELESRTPARHNLYGSQSAFGIAVKAKGWAYPWVINLDSGEVTYDPYGCAPDRVKELDRFTNRYALEEIRIHVCELGFELHNEQELENGVYEFELHVVGA